MIDRVAVNVLPQRVLTVSRQSRLRVTEIVLPIPRRKWGGVDGLYGCQQRLLSFSHHRPQAVIQLNVRSPGP
jgi:hypothetical protein